MWSQGKDRHGRRAEHSRRHDVRTKDSGNSACYNAHSVPASSRTLPPRKVLKRERERELKDYFTDFKSPDLLIHPSEGKNGCASQFLWSQ